MRGERLSGSSSEPLRQAGAIPTLKFRAVPGLQLRRPKLFDVTPRRCSGRPRLRDGRAESGLWRFPQNFEAPFLFLLILDGFLAELVLGLPLASTFTTRCAHCRANCDVSLAHCWSAGIVTFDSAQTLNAASHGHCRLWSRLCRTRRHFLLARPAISKSRKRGEAARAAKASSHEGPRRQMRLAITGSPPAPTNTDASHRIARTRSQADLHTRMAMYHGAR